MKSDSLEVCSYSSFTACILLLRVDWHHLAKWFSFPQEVHFTPHAGHCCWPNRCVPPQNLQMRRDGPFLSPDFWSASTSVFDSWSLRSVWLAQVCCCPWPYVLLLLQTDEATLFACLRLRSTCRCHCSVEASIVVVVITYRLRVPESLIPSTILSRIRESFRQSQKFLDWAKILSSANFWSMDSPSCWPPCWIDSAQMSHLSLRSRICRRLLWLHQGFACLRRLNQRCCRFLLLVDQSNIETGQFSIPPFVRLAVRRFGNFSIVCRVSNFHSCFSRTNWVLLVAVCLGLPPLIVLLLQWLVLQIRCRSFSYFKRSHRSHHVTFYSLYLNSTVIYDDDTQVLSDTRNRTWSVYHYVM